MKEILARSGIEHNTSELKRFLKNILVYEHCICFKKNDKPVSLTDSNKAFEEGHFHLLLCLEKVTVRASFMITNII